MKKICRIIIFTFSLTSFCTSALADSPVDYVSLQIRENSISIDSFGATSIDDKSITYQLSAASIINNNLIAEYGFMSLGVYKAKYDITVGTFQFLESHTVDFSKSLFASIKLGTTLSGLASYMTSKTPGNESNYPPKNELYLSAKYGVLLWQANLDMDGYMYDSGSPFGPYGATSNNYGFSSFYGFGAEYSYSDNIIFDLTWSIYLKVGEGAKLKYLDGSTEKYSGRNIESFGLGITYVF